ncbi:uncharacterized protein LOC133395091 [Anopheles gambiae]|uniref:uncharacterized protein LOC133395091 n=1 Tax=Anopheles gambiae TaxID=7165 RepID=UPI002AC92215|nr:uncharacterized protein LOC133395091 [Anopheles gambiae]
MRTALALLKPPPAAQAEPANLDRRFQRGDLVYAKFYARNSWKWVPAQIIRELGSVMFEVQTNNQRVHRRHVNQLAADRDVIRDSAVGASSEDVDIDHLPFDLLTDSARVTHTTISTPNPVRYYKTPAADTVATPVF